MYRGVQAVAMLWLVISPKSVITRQQEQHCNGLLPVRTRLESCLPHDDQLAEKNQSVCNEKCVTDRVGSHGCTNVCLPCGMRFSCYDTAERDTSIVCDS